MGHARCEKAAATAFVTVVLRGCVCVRRAAATVALAVRADEGDFAVRRICARYL
jgi:hypothetical protein